METKFNYIIVGAFVLIFVTAMVLVGVWLLSYGNHHDYKTYAVITRDTVAGLNENAPVRFNGVEVGYVDSINLNVNDPQVVRLLLKIDEMVKINTGTTATIMTQGLTGVAYMGLKTDSADGPLIEALPDQPYPVIPSTPSMMSRMDTTLQTVSKAMSQVADTVNQLLDPATRKSIQQTLAHLDVITGTIADGRKELSESMVHINAASAQFPQLIDSLMQTSNQINNLALQLEGNPSVIIRGQKPLPPGPGE